MTLAGLRFFPQLTNANTRSLGITLTLEPSVGISAAKIDRLGADIRSFHEPLKQAVKEVMIPSFYENFVSGGRPKWPPLAESTLTVRRTQWNFGGTDPLLLTHALMHATQHINLWTITKSAAFIVGLPENVWYGAIHQRGSMGPMSRGLRPETLARIQARMQTMGVGMRIPARPFLMIQSEDEEAIEQIFKNWLDERVAHHYGSGRGPVKPRAL